MGASAPVPAPMTVFKGKVGAAPVGLSVQKSLIINTAVGGIALSSVSPECLERAGELGASGEFVGFWGGGGCSMEYWPVGVGLWVCSFNLPPWCKNMGAGRTQPALWGAAS